MSRENYILSYFTEYNKKGIIINTYFEIEEISFSGGSTILYYKAKGMPEFFACIFPLSTEEMKLLKKVTQETFYTKKIKSI